MSENRSKFPISPRTLGLILLVVAAALSPLLRPNPEEPKAHSRAPKPPHPTATTTSRTAAPRLAYTNHARERFSERHISEEDALEVLTTPDKREHEKPGEDGGEVYKYLGRVNGRALVIVAEAKGEHYTIITGYWDD